MSEKAGIRALCILFVLYSYAPPEPLLAQGMPPASQSAQTVAPGPRPDTAGSRLRAVWAKARLSYPDALLVAISARTSAAGTVLCDHSAPFQDGWRFTFYSPKRDEFLLMAECGGTISGPLSQLAQDEPPPHGNIRGRFEDSDVALRALEKSGVSLDPEIHKTGGKRPFSLRLSPLDDARFPDHPVLWSIKIGEHSFLLDAATGGRFPPSAGGQGAMISSATDRALPWAESNTSPAVPGAITRPVPRGSATSVRSWDAAERASKALHTAKKDLPRVLEFAQRQYPGARLMAIEGSVDSWGSASCSSIKDGWAYYFYFPKEKGYEAIFACNGEVAPGPAQYAPVDMDLHQPIQGEFIDSDGVLDAVSARRPALLNGGNALGIEPRGTLLLLNYRSAPFSQQGSWKTTMVWQLKLGETLLKFDAINARLLDVTE